MNIIANSAPTYPRPVREILPEVAETCYSSSPTVQRFILLRVLRWINLAAVADETQETAIRELDWRYWSGVSEEHLTVFILMLNGLKGLKG